MQYVPAVCAGSMNCAVLQPKASRRGTVQLSQRAASVDLPGQARVSPIGKVLMASSGDERVEGTASTSLSDVASVFTPPGWARGDNVQAEPAAVVRLQRVLNFCIRSSQCSWRNLTGFAS
jgi:hypothetical protein